MEELSRPPREELQLRAVREILRASAAALPLDEILAVVANISIITFDASTAWFMLIDGRTLRTAIARGQLAPGLEGLECEASACTRAGEALDQPLTLEPSDLDAADPVLGPFAAESEPVVLLPLRSAGQTLGLLGAAVPASALPDISFLGTMAEQASAAIEATHLRQETRTWRERLDAVFEQMSEPVMVYDREATLVLMNQAAGQMLAGRNVRLGDSLAQMLEKAGLRDPSGTPVDPVLSAPARALAGERVVYQERSLLVTENAIRHLVTSAVPLIQDGRIEGAVVVWRDITYLKDLERERAQFLSMVSHELRNPLTTILGLAQIMQRDLQDGSGEKLNTAIESLEMVIDEARRMNLLVGDLMDASMAEGGRLTLTRQSVDLEALVRQVVDHFTSAAPEHHFVLEAAKGLPRVMADEGRLEQVLRNLVSNAVKYSPQASTVSVRARRDGGRAVISVSDQGSGIPREEMPALFMPFHRIQRKQTRGRPGVGLGLFISKSIIEAHDGAIWVDSEPGKGSTFSFSIPFHPPA